MLRLVPRRPNAVKREAAKAKSAIYQKTQGLAADAFRPSIAAHPRPQHPKTGGFFTRSADFRIPSWASIAAGGTNCSKQTRIDRSE